MGKRQGRTKSVYTRLVSLKHEACPLGVAMRDQLARHAACHTEQRHTASTKV
eukprot:CAMPEP_0183356934 /NCGR_PEP_ID=MMETSP0164_2-20130417/45279_1 /TAXON_ID=221442 /ORGANISM="Coccolithus pelagicus ssp braarudi, Strain PLY182g" /LENGTH=51 /DNA_ID=CAMNT_0025530455 /DNA_START=172 /DNA_END=327 /DNA_ORIENTATION=-